MIQKQQQMHGLSLENTSNAVQRLFELKNETSLNRCCYSPFEIVSILYFSLQQYLQNFELLITNLSDFATWDFGRDKDVP